MQRLELPEVEALAQSRQLVPSDDDTAYADYRLADQPGRRTGFWILLSATALTLFWIGGAMAFLYGYYGLDRFGFDTAQIMSFLHDRFTFESWFVLAAVLLVPTCFAWMTTLVGIRMVELSERARELSDISRRLTAPEQTATKSVARLGHAVRREVNSLNDGIDAAVARIAELRDSVHDEAVKLERIAEDAEERARRVRAVITEERSKLTNVVERFETEANSLVEALGNRSDRLIDTLTNTASELVQSINEKTHAFVDGVERTGALVSHALDQKSLEATRRFETGAQGLADKLTAAGKDLAHTMSEQYALADGRLKASGAGLVDLMHAAQSAARKAFEHEADEMRKSLSEREAALIDAAQKSSVHLSRTLSDSATSLTHKLAASAATMDNTLKERGDAFARAFQEQNAQLSKLLADIRQDVAGAIERLGHGVAEQGKATIAVLKKNGEQIVSMLGQKSGEMAELMEKRAALLKDAAGKADGRLEAVSSLLEQHSAGLEKAAKSAVDSAQFASKELADQSIRLEAASDKALERAGVITDRYAKQRTAIESTAEGLSRENARLEGTLDSQKRVLQEIAELAANQGQRIKTVLSQSTDELRKAIEHIVTQSAAAQDTLSSHTRSTRESGESAATALHKATEAARLAAEEARRVIDERARTMAEKIDSVGQAADGALERVRVRLGEYADTLKSDVAGAAANAEQATKTAHDRLAAEIVGMNERLTHSADTIHDIADRISTTVEHVTEAASEATERLEGAMLDLEARLAEFPEHTEESARHLREAFQQQMRAFSEAAAKAAGEARTLDESLRKKLALNYETIGKFLLGDAPSRDAPAESKAAAESTTNGASPTAEEAWMGESDLVAFVRPNGRREPAASESTATPSPDQASLAKRLAVRLRRSTASEAEARHELGANAVSQQDMPAVASLGETTKRRRVALSNGDAAMPQPTHTSARSWKWRDVLAAADAAPANARDGAHMFAKRSHDTDSATHMLDSLHALAVELTRSIEDRMSVPLVRRYLKGEKELFARRLVDGDKNKTISQMKSKYKADTAFKATADQYMARFDELMEQSVGGDSGQNEAERVLQTSAGQVYLMLREATGRVF